MLNTGPAKLPSAFLGCDAGFAAADTAIFGAPFDGTVSYRPGARFGPQQMRMESISMETYSPYLDEDLLDRAIVDLGDLELPFGNTELALKLIQEQAAVIVQAGKKPLMLGGEHLVTLPAAEAVLANYPDLCFVHFDANADLRESYLDERLSHASVMRRLHELVGDDRIFQFGIRSGEREEFVFANSGHISQTLFTTKGVEVLAERLGNKPVYLTIDLDVLDPSVFPGTGTPEPGGLTFSELLAAIHALKTLNLVAADLVELAPQYDTSGISTAAALKLMREVLLLLASPVETKPTVIEPAETETVETDSSSEQVSSAAGTSSKEQQQNVR